MTADAPACVDRAESQAYVAEVRTRAFAHWKPDGVEPGSEVVIAFRLDEQGQVVTSEVRGSPSKSESFAARRALGGGAPYPPMPEDAKCLAGTDLSLTFRAPEATAPAKARRIETPPPSPQVETFSYVARWYKLAIVVALFTAVVRPLVRRRVVGRTSSDPAPPAERVFIDHELRFFSTGGFENAYRVLAAHLLLFVWHGPVALALFALLDAAALAELLHTRRAPLVRLTAGEIAVDGSLFTSVRRIATSRLASWVASASLLGLRDVDGQDVWIPMSLLRRADQEQVGAFVLGLQRVGAGLPALTLGDLGRRERRGALVASALLVAATLIELLVG